jgi:hypothetical protein
MFNHRYWSWFMTRIEKVNPLILFLKKKKIKKIIFLFFFKKSWWTFLINFHRVNLDNRSTSIFNRIIQVFIYFCFFMNRFKKSIFLTVKCFITIVYTHIYLNIWILDDLENLSRELLIERVDTNFKISQLNKKLL